MRTTTMGRPAISSDTRYRIHDYVHGARPQDILIEVSDPEKIIDYRSGKTDYQTRADVASWPEGILRHLRMRPGAR